MKPDPIVEEVRAAREAHAKKFNFNISEICADLKEKERISNHKIVSKPPKIVKQKTGS